VAWPGCFGKKNVLLKCIEMQDLHAISSIQVFLKLFNNFFCVDFLKKLKMKFKLFHLDII